MTTSIVFLVFIGCFFFYNTSKKAELKRSFTVEKWIQDHPQNGKILGSILLLAAGAISSACWGTGAGLFAFFVILMTVMSCVVLFAPLRYAKSRVLSFVFLLSILLELISS